MNLIHRYVRGDSYRYLHFTNGIMTIFTTCLTLVCGSMTIFYDAFDDRWLCVLTVAYIVYTIYLITYAQVHIP